MTIVHTLLDDRGDELEAYCELLDPKSFTWYVKVVSDKGSRGGFGIRLPPGTDQRTAIGREVLLRGIHATNKTL